MDYSSPGSSVHGFLQTRIMEWVAISFSRGSSQPRDGTWVSYIAGRFFTVWITREAQEYWESSLGNLPDPGIESGSPALQVNSLPAELPGKLLTQTLSLNVLTACFFLTFVLFTHLHNCTAHLHIPSYLCLLPLATSINFKVNFYICSITSFIGNNISF